MPRIVDMAFKRGRPERFTVQTDDSRCFVLSPDTVAQFGIAPQKEFPPEDWEHILQVDALRRAKDQAMRFLAVRPHSRKELTLKLRQKGFDEKTIQQALDDLERVNLVNDPEFARLFIENELTLRPAGQNLLRQKLRQRGIPDEIFEPLLSEAYQKVSETEIALKLAHKYLKLHRTKAPAKKKEGLIRYLQSKGFDWDVLQQILHQLDIG